MKFGRNRPVVRARALSLGNYLLRSYAPPPAIVDYTPKAAAALSQIYLNDSLGDCVEACIGHLEGVFTGNASGIATIYSGQQIIGAYEAMGGYVDGVSASDQGTDEQTALQMWESNGFCGSKISGWIRVNGADPTEVRTALYLFGNLMFGMELPNAWVDNGLPTTSGFIWDIAGPSNPSYGHCVGGVGYAPGKIAISTWGLTGWITDAAVAEYATLPLQGELYTVLSSDWISKIGVAPNGFAMTALQADLDSMK